MRHLPSDARERTLPARVAGSRGHAQLGLAAARLVSGGSGRSEGWREWSRRGASATTEGNARYSAWASLKL